MEIGYIQDLDMSLSVIKGILLENKNDNEDNLTLENIFGEVKNLSYNSIEFISFDYDTGMIQKKSETSWFSKLGYKVLKRFKPRSIF